MRNIRTYSLTVRIRQFHNSTRSKEVKEFDEHYNWEKDVKMAIPEAEATAYRK